MNLYARGNRRTSRAIGNRELQRAGRLFRQASLREVRNCENDDRDTCATEIRQKPCCNHPVPPPPASYDSIEHFKGVPGVAMKRPKVCIPYSERTSVYHRLVETAVTLSRLTRCRGFA